MLVMDYITHYLSRVITKFFNFLWYFFPQSSKSQLFHEIWQFYFQNFEEFFGTGVTKFVETALFSHQSCQ